MKIFISALIVLIAQAAAADKTVNGKELEQYKEATIIAVAKSNFQFCNGTWNAEDLIRLSHALTIADSTTTEPVIFAFTAYRYLNSYEHADFTYDEVHFSFTTDERSQEITYAVIHAYNYELVNKGTLKDPIIVKQLTLQQTCEMN